MTTHWHNLKFILVITSLWLISFASAHEVRPSIVDLTIDNKGQYQLTLKVNLESLIAKINIQHENTDSDDNSIKYNELRKLSKEGLHQEFNSFVPYFLDHLNLTFDNERQVLKTAIAVIPEVGDIELARDSVIKIQGDIPLSTQSILWQWDASFGNAVLRVSTPQNPEIYSAYLLDGKSSDDIVIGLSSPNSSAQNSQKVGGCAFDCKWKSFLNYLQVGYVHILPKGLDHILFVVGLFLLSASLKPLLIQVTTFTLAHSITLALGLYGIVNFSSAIVEPLIAASIIVVCLENIYSSKLSRWRPFVIFLFGLLHGLGFASVLKEIGLSPENYVSSLVAFNIGVEFGQLTVISLCFLAVGFWFRNKSWYRKAITIPASIVIAIVASYWFVERLGWA